MIVVTRKLHVISESWLTRQLLLLSPVLTKIIVMEDTGLKEFAGIPVISLDPRKEIFYRLFNLISSQDYKAIMKSRLHNLLSKDDSKLVMFHYIDFALNFTDVIKKSSKTCLIHCHGYDVTWDLRSHENPNERKFSKDYIPKILELAKSAQFIANSVNTKQKLLEINIPEEIIHVKYFGIQKQSFRPIPKSFKILYVGRLVDFKGADMVIKAFELACKKGLDGELIIAGNGQLRVTLELLKRHSEINDRIHLLGSVGSEEVKSLMNEASVFTAHNCTGPLTRQEEAFGVTLIEAMSLGVPVITGHVGGVKEIVTNNENGFLIEPFDIEAHAQAFLKYYKNPNLLELHGKNAQQSVVNKFSEEQELNFFHEIRNSS